MRDEWESDLLHFQEGDFEGACTKFTTAVKIAGFKVTFRNRSVSYARNYKFHN